jgi:hypothetical protein
MRKDLRFWLRSLSSVGAERSIKRIAALWRSALVRDVQVTLQDVHHPRCHENGQRLAGNVGLPEMCRSVQFHSYGFGVNRDLILPRVT